MYVPKLIDRNICSMFEKLAKKFAEQGCQIFLGNTYQTVENIPKSQQINQKALNYTKHP
jgi:hypothetical protein